MQDRHQAEPENKSPGQHPVNVCGRVITNDPIFHYPTLYQGRMIYFCTEFCLEAFLADPDRFYNAHSTKKA